MILNGLATLASRAGDHAGAVELLRDALALARAAPEPDRVLIAQLEAGQARDLLRSGGDPEQAIEELRGAASTLASELGLHPDRVSADNELAVQLLEHGQPAEARDLLIDVIDMRERLGLGEHVWTAHAWTNLGMAHKKLGGAAEAEAAYRTALDLHERTTGRTTLAAAGCMHNLSRTLFQQGRLAEAAELAREALAVYRSLELTDDPLQIYMYELLGMVALLGGDAGAAAEPFEAAVTLGERILPAGDSRTARMRLYLGRALLDLGLPEEALAHLTESLQHLEPTSPSARDAATLAARACEQLGDEAGARRWRAHGAAQ